MEKLFQTQFVTQHGDPLPKENKPSRLALCIFAQKNVPMCLEGVTRRFEVKDALALPKPAALGQLSGSLCAKTGLMD